MDDLDLQIMKILSYDARTPFSKIAKTLGVGTDTIFRRYKKLKKLKIIQGATIVLDSRACGFKGLIGLFIKAKSTKDVKSVNSQIAEIKNITMIQRTLGDFDFYCDFSVVDFDECLELFEILRRITEIEVIKFVIYLDKEWPIPYVPQFDPNIQTPIDSRSFGGEIHSDY